MATIRTILEIEVEKDEGPYVNVDEVRDELIGAIEQESFSVDESEFSVVSVTQLSAREAPKKEPPKKVMGWGDLPEVRSLLRSYDQAERYGLSVREDNENAKDLMASVAVLLRRFKVLRPEGE